MKPNYNGRIALELYEVESAEVLATYGVDFYAGRPAVTVNRVGKGFVFYQCARSDQAFLHDFHHALMKRFDIVPYLPSVTLPEGVTIQCRESDDGARFYFFLNATRAAQRIRLNAWRGRDIESAALLDGEFVLEPYGCVSATGLL